MEDVNKRIKRKEESQMQANPRKGKPNYKKSNSNELKDMGNIDSQKRA